MAEVAVNVMNFTMKNSLNDVMNPLVANILRRTNAVAVCQAKAGYLATVIFKDFEDMAEAGRHLKKLKVDFVCDRRPGYVDSEMLKRDETKLQEKKEAEERFLYEFIYKTEAEKTEIMRQVKELDAEVVRLRKLVADVKQKDENVISAKDEQIKELTKEILRLEHRLKEMEELRMRTLNW